MLQYFNNTGISVINHMILNEHFACFLMRSLKIDTVLKILHFYIQESVSDLDGLGII